MGLQEKLETLRDAIKEEERLANGRASAVCSDDAIIEIVKTLPRNKDELIAIDGLGKTFCTKYADRFLKIVDDYVKAQTKLFKTNGEVVNTLKELEKKLVNLNKSNKMLYISRMSAKSVIDITTLCDTEGVLSLLFREKRKLKVCDLQESNKEQYKLNESNYRKLTQLMREISRDFREKGQYDLYIGYPFVKGQIVKDDFEFNAPLMLWPIIITKEPNYCTLSIDLSRDIVYNTNMLLAMNKFIGGKRALPNNVAEEVAKDNFVHGIKEFYAAQGLAIEGDCGTVTEFTTANHGSTKRNVFTMASHMVLGKFSTYSSSIQKDINDIIERLEINGLLKDLLQGVDDVDMYAEDVEVDAHVLEMNNNIQERYLNYINPLNSTQENIVIAAKNNKELVVQGPPGTGKSQVITSLIAAAALEGKSVLMVSEKKSALDVVYSRLGKLSDYTLLIDDVNKDNFYTQLKRLTELQPQFNKDTDDTVATDVDNYMYSLSVIADKMCDSSLYGVEVYKLYQTYPKWNLDTAKAVQQYKIIGNFMEPLKNIGMDKIAKINSMYRNAALGDKLSDYLRIIDNYPIVLSLKDNISASEIVRAADTLEHALKDYKNSGGTGLFKRNKDKKQAEKTVRVTLDKLTDKLSSSDLRDVLSGVIHIQSVLKSYGAYVDAKQVYDKLIIEAKDYFKAIYGLSRELGEAILKANDMAYRYLINEALTAFESENRTTLHNINNYNGVLDILSKLLNNKSEATRAKLAEELGNSLKFINKSKRLGEIKRCIESSRRWSIKKFTDKFSYELFRGVKVWLLTPEVVSEIMPLVNGLFDLVIFDEASQMYIEKAIPAIMRAKSVIIAGDSKQLRPSNLGVGRIDIADEDDEDELEDIAALEEESLLDVARFKYPPVMLDFHYRSKYAELIAFSNYAFYGGKLNVSPNPIPPTRPPIEVVNVKDGLWENRCNPQEAREVIKLLKHVIETRKNNESIGIITFNSAQRDLIMDVIDDTAATDAPLYKALMKEMQRKDNGEDTGLFIKNIENVQGDEREIIIFSIAYAKNAQGKLVKQFGWLNQRGGENRLNVAISRAKSKVYVVKSVAAGEFDVEESRNDGPRYLKRYLEYAEAVSAGDRETARRILFSFSEGKTDRSVDKQQPKIAKQLRHELERRGYEVEENVGIGDYNIDMAVKVNGLYKLGIEFDSSLYDVSRNTRERDYHRWNYFRLRGWHMYRVWSSAWWDNPGLELGRILKKLS